MQRVKTPKVYKNDDIAPEVSKHFSDDTESPGKWTGESVFVLVDNHKTLNFLDFISKNIHQLFNKLCVSLILIIDTLLKFGFTKSE